MLRILLVTAFLTCSVLPVQSQDHAQKEGWTGYHNARFGFSLSYPSHIFQVERTTESGDGQLFVSRDGSARLLVGAFANTDRHSPRSYQDLIAHDTYAGFTVDYAPTGPRWSVLSGAREGTMFYEKAIFSCQGKLINSFAMTYPVAERKLYDAIVEQIEDTFRAGEAGCT